MVTLELCFEDGNKRVVERNLPLRIGRDPSADLHLRAWRVARRHACIRQRGSGIFVEDFGSIGGTNVNGQRIAEYGPLLVGDEILVGPCLMRVLSLPPTIAHDSPVPHDSEQAERAISMSQVPVNEPGAEPCNQERLMHQRRLHAALLEALDLRRRDITNMTDEALRSEAIQVLHGLIEEDEDLPPSIPREALLRDVVNEAVGLGPLEPLLADRTVSEIMVNRHDEIYVETAGQLRRSPIGFSSEQAVLGVIERIVSPLGRRIDEASPMVDARLQDGSRVNAIIAPVALRGASLTIRKFPERRLNLEDMQRIGTLDVHMAAFLSACVRYRKNIIVSGGTGSGKTTLLNILSNCIPDAERVITIEDAAELKLDHAHVVALEARPANLEGKGRIDIRDLVRNALRMRPDRIVVGECRGGEAFDMLAAMNTGHEGSLTTLHANNPRDALARLETMILMAGMDLPLVAVREHIASSIHIIVQQARLPDGHRVITSIIEVTGMESGRIQTQELFRLVRGPSMAFQGCGVIPECFLDEGGSSSLPIAVFNQETPLQRQSLASTTDITEGVQGDAATPC